MSNVAKTLIEDPMSSPYGEITLDDLLATDRHTQQQQEQQQPMSRDTGHDSFAAEEEARDTLPALSSTPRRSINRHHSGSLVRGPPRRTQSLRVAHPGLSATPEGTPVKVPPGRSASLRTPPDRTSSLRVRRPPSRTHSTDSVTSLRGMRRDQLVNVAIERREDPRKLQRYASGSSDDGLSIGSEFDGISRDTHFLRKGILIADPLEDGTYLETDSYADHESCIYSLYGDDCEEYGVLTEHLPGGYGRRASEATESVITMQTIDSVNLHRLHIKEVDKNGACDVSVFSNDNTADFLDDLDEVEYESNKSETEESSTNNA